MSETIMNELELELDMTDMDRLIAICRSLAAEDGVYDLADLKQELRDRGLD